VLVLGARETALDFLRIAAEVGVGARAIVRSTGEELLAKVRAGASHPPGPRVITGEYLGSIQLAPADDGGVEVFSNHPAANRLEHGFHGVDSLGRHYHQRGHPHWGPAMSQVDGKFYAKLDALVALAVGV
jgi:hypothetical protein